VDIDGNYLFVSAFNNDALQLIDISNPASPMDTLYLRDQVRLDGATSVDVV
jgi:hypothetical protein